RDLPLSERKTKLAHVLKRNGHRQLLTYCEHWQDEAPKLLQAACDRGADGLIAKRADAPYTAGRTRDWLKVKCERRQDCVIVGYTTPQGRRTSFGALLLAVAPSVPGRGGLKYCGRVGTGFDARLLGELKAKLALRERSTPAASGILTHERRGAHWVEPE